MRLRLPFSLRKSVLSSLVSMVALSLGSGSACAVTESESQNLVFDGATLTWNTNTENKAFTNAAGESASFATGDNVTFASDASVSLGEDISAGQINIASGADVVIELADNGLNFDTLSMLGGSLYAGDSLNIAAGETLAVGSNGSVLKSDLVLEKNAGLSVDYAGTGSATSLNTSALSLQGGTRLQLSGCGNGDGKTYTLLTGVSELRDSQGNAISLEKGNNAISNYFDTSQPGTGFWANGTLVLNDGSLQLVRHNQVVKEALTITTQQTGNVNYQYYAGVSFENISSSFDGGAIYGDSYSTITLSNNGSVTFSRNTVSGSGAGGGAIYGKTITLSNNGSVMFSQNKVEDIHEGGTAWGGAISCSWGDITLNDNGSVIFVDNQSITDYHSAGGGAIEMWGGNLTINNNGQVCFRNNSAEVLFSGGYGSGVGGAIFQGSGSFYLCNNEEVEFTGNRSQGLAGAAIRTQGDLYIHNNGRILFENNVEVAYDGSYRLHCIYSSGDVLSLSAGEKQSIEFRDSVYIRSGAIVQLNADYGDTKQQGDIIFTGKYTEQHLNEALAAAGENRKATEQEILNSRTSYVYAMTNLYGGRLRVEDEAVYQGYGITAHAGSESTVLVKDAVLNHTGYELHFYEGTKLEALGESEIFGDVIVESTATAAFSALTRLEGSLTLASGSTLLLEGALTLDGALALGTSLTLGGNMLEMVNLLQAGQSLTLMSGLDSLAVQTGESEYTTIASGQELLAADYFSNLDSGKELVFVYNGEAGSLSMMRVIPEPATATLSLLALTALMARRRRR